MGIQAVFWDYDNTILATAEAHWKKHQVVLLGLGIELSEIYRQQIYENNGNQNWAWMSKDLGLAVPEKEYLAAVDGEFQRHMLSLEMRPGVADLFELLNQRGIPQAIITNARRDSAKPVLDGKNITPLMQFVLFKEDYSGRKPEPTPYLQGFQKMGEILRCVLDPKRCLAIEDDPKGVESAHRAGAIVIHRKLDPEDPPAPYADYSCFHSEDLFKIVYKFLN